MTDPGARPPPDAAELGAQADRSPVLAERMEVLRAGELVLEPLTLAHAGPMFELLADPRIYRYLDYGPPPSLAHLRSVYRQLERRVSPDGAEQWLNWVVSAPGSGPVGFVQATVVDGHAAWVAYVLGRPHWGRGIAQASVRAMLAHLHDRYGVETLLATVEAENDRSVRLLERLGFGLSDRAPALAPDLAASERLYERSAAPPAVAGGPATPTEGDPMARTSPHRAAWMAAAATALAVLATLHGAPARAQSVMAVPACQCSAPTTAPGTTTTLVHCLCGAMTCVLAQPSGPGAGAPLLQCVR